MIKKPVEVGHFIIYVCTVGIKAVTIHLCVHMFMHASKTCVYNITCKSLHVLCEDTLLQACYILI